MAHALRIAVPLGFVPILVWLTWPLPAHWLDHFPDTVARGGGFGWAGFSDMHMSAWALAWDVHALTTQPARLFDANIFHPAPSALAYSEHFLGHLLVALPVHLATGNPVLAFNLALLASTLGAALSMYTLAWRWTGSRLAAFGAGLTFAQVGHELQVVGAAYLPLVPLFLDRWLERRRAVELWGLGVSLLLQTLCSYYQGYAAFLVLGIHLTVLAVRGTRAGLGAAIGVAAAVATAAAIVSIPYLRLAAAGVLPPVDLDAARLMSAQLRLMAPAGPLFPGWVVLVLALIGIVARPRRADVRVLAIIVGAAGALLAAGPWEMIGGVRVPLPYRLLHATVPGFSAVRFPVRLLSVARFGGGLLVALGIARLATPLRVAALGALLLSRMSEGGALGVRPAALGTTPSPVYRVLASATEPGALLELPMGYGGDPRGPYRETAYMLASTVHWKPLINGYSGYVPPTYDLLAARARWLPEPGALQDLVDMAGLRWVIVHAGRGPVREAWRPLIEAGTVRVLADEEDALLLAVDLPARRPLEASLRDAVLHRPTTTLLGASLAPLPPGALRATVTFPRLPQPQRPGAPLRVTPTVRNDGDALWPGLGVWPDGLIVVDVHWTDESGARVGSAARGLRLPRDLAPGESVTVEAFLSTPRRAGTHRLEVVVRQVGNDAESVPASLTVAVSP